MSSMLRMMAMVLALANWSAPQVLAAFGAPDDCAEEEGDCADCTTPCACCAGRVATLTGLVQSPVRIAAEPSVMVRVDEPVLAAVNPDIFHPPRA